MSVGKQAVQLFAALLLTTSSALGQSGSGQTLTPVAEEARALFEEARRLLELQRPEEACDVLDRALALEVTVATLLNLGLCNTQSGRLARAREHFLHARAVALELGDERASIAKAEATALESKLDALVLSVAARADPALAISIDGSDVPREQWGVPIYLDSRQHVVQARSGIVLWREDVAAGPGLVRPVNVPVLLQPSPTVAPRAAEPPAPSRTRAAPSGSDKQRIVGFTLAALGVVGLGIAGGFGVAALNTLSDSNSQCSPRNICTDEGLAQRDLANTNATRADVAAASGLIALTAGAVLVLTAGGGAPAEASPPRAATPRVHGPLQVAVTWPL